MCSSDLIESISAENEQETVEGKDLRTKIAEGSKKTVDSISGLLAKKKTPQVPVANDDVLSTIKKLSELRDLGIITQEEFDAKKTELLGKI